MILFVLAYFGGVLTILSPCILPVLPLVFAHAGRPVFTSIVPLLMGMVLTFAMVATLAAIGGGWVVQANQYGRLGAIILMGVFGLTLLVPELADRLTRPLVALGGRLSQSTGTDISSTRSSVIPSLLLGVATGLLWAPCAGPILGLVLTGAALSGANLQTTVLLVAYASGAATSLAVAILIGGRVFTAMKRSLGVGQWVRRGLGVAVLAAVTVMALRLDTGLLTQISLARTAPLEQALIDQMQRQPSVLIGGDGDAMMADANAMKGAPMMMAAASTAAPHSEGFMPDLSGATLWLNSQPLTAQNLKGKVVLIDFWTYSCINCLRTLPYVRGWAEKYKDQGLVVIGIHTPEFAFERDTDNVRKALADLHIAYPVAMDNDYAIWRAFGNSYWPAHYFVDANGQIRHHHFGEGEYEQSEKIIQQLLAEAGRTGADSPPLSVAATGPEAAPDLSDVQSPETYIGFGRGQNFAASGGVVPDRPHVYTTPASLALNQWSLAGDWTVAEDSAHANTSKDRIAFRFHARDLHLVLGPSPDGRPVRFHVLLDGKDPDASHGADIDDHGNGMITEHRLYQLIRQSQPVADHQFDIEFLDPGVQAFAFTFG